MSFEMYCRVLSFEMYCHVCWQLIEECVCPDDVELDEDE